MNKDERIAELEKTLKYAEKEMRNAIENSISDKKELVETLKQLVKERVKVTDKIKANLADYIDRDEFLRDANKELYRLEVELEKEREEKKVLEEMGGVCSKHHVKFKPSNGMCNFCREDIKALEEKVKEHEYVNEEGCLLEKCPHYEASKICKWPCSVCNRLPAPVRTDGSKFPDPKAEEKYKKSV